MRKAILLAASLMFFALVTATSAPYVSAHEERRVDEFRFEVGWVSEPPIVEVKNGIDLRINGFETGEPIEGAERTLKVEVSAGGKKVELELRPQFGQPGAYTADLIPTVPGTYTFRFFGTINVHDEAHNVDASFESGEHFASPVLPGDMQFPEKLPTVGQLKKNTDELQPIINELQGKVVELERSRDVAYGVAIGGITAGIIGAVLGAFSIRRKTHS